MFKKPLEYTEDDIVKLLYKKLSIDIGSSFNDQMGETLEGEITNYTMAISSPPLIGIIDFQLNNGEIRKFTFPEIKNISLIEK